MRLETGQAVVDGKTGEPVLTLYLRFEKAEWAAFVGEVMTPEGTTDHKKAKRLIARAIAAALDNRVEPATKEQVKLVTQEVSDEEFRNITKGKLQ